MSTCVRSCSKINLGLAIGAPRPDGFHPLTTLYQTIEAHDVLTVEARLADWQTGRNRIYLTSNDPRVPLDERNTVWKMLERAFTLQPLAGKALEVRVHIDKRMPIRGGLGAGSANAAAALVGLERELGRLFPAIAAGQQGSIWRGDERLRIAAEVGSDVPMFLIGGTVLGVGRGEEVYPMPDLPSVTVVVALPDVGVSTPQAFREWDAGLAQRGASVSSPVSGPVSGAGAGSDGGSGASVGTGLGINALTAPSAPLTLGKLSRALAASLCEPYSSGVFHGTSLEDLAENPLLALVRTGIRNDFEEVVFRLHPSLGKIKRALLGSTATEDSLSAGHTTSFRKPFESHLEKHGQAAGRALYAALSGSGSAVFGLYNEEQDADLAEQRLASLGVRFLRTRTLGRAEYWKTMLIPA